jgi:Mn2+/Fe2+ NRAMP family transporter
VQQDDTIASAADHYTQPAGAIEEPPSTWLETVKYLGPSVIISATIVGSGEIILTASLGAAVGYIMMWWVLFSCWSKSILQAELARYIVLSGDTYLRAISRVPGKIRGPRGEFGWPILLGLIAFVPGLTGLGGLIGGSGLALELLFPELDARYGVGLLAVITAILLSTGSYRRLESVMLLFVITFTVLTVVSAILMQTTDYATRLDQVTSGFDFYFPFENAEWAVLALAAYGYTGVNSGEISSYSYWCIEKGYPGRIGPYQDTPEWYNRAHGWLKVLRTDVWITLVLLTCATIPFYFLGAGILNSLGLRPQGNDTIVALSGMFTETLGGWSLWIFAVGAFCILYSSTVAAVAGGSRYIPDYLIELGFLSRDRIDVRRKIIRGYSMIVPFVGFALYLGFQRPVLMVTISACFAAIMLPMQSGITLYLQAKRLPKQVRPGRLASSFLKVIFVVQLILAFAVIRFTVF